MIKLVEMSGDVWSPIHVYKYTERLREYHPGSSHQLITTPFRIGFIPGSGLPQAQRVDSQAELPE